MKRMSNRERIAHAAEEARLSALEKAEKTEKAAAKPAPARKSKAAANVRVKIVWEVCSPTGAVVKTFAYPDKGAAEAAVLALTKSTSRPHSLRGTKVPME